MKKDFEEKNVFSKFLTVICPKTKINDENYKAAKSARWILHYIWILFAVVGGAMVLGAIFVAATYTNLLGIWLTCLLVGLVLLVLTLLDILLLNNLKQRLGTFSYMGEE